MHVGRIDMRCQLSSLKQAMMRQRQEMEKKLLPSPDAAIEQLMCATLGSAAPQS